MPVDSGTQTVTLKFYDAANTGLVNTRFKDVREVGMYSGGYLSVVDASHCLLSTFIAEVADATYQVKISTATAVNIAVGLATPYVVIRWMYTGSASLDYASLIAVVTPAVNDVIVGKCSFSGVTLVGFDYGDATYSRTSPDTHALYLNVEPTADTELRVRIRTGVVQGFNATTHVPDQISNLFVAPAANSQIFLVYVDPDTGAVVIDSSGTAAAVPVAPVYAGKIVLAEITLTSTSTNIIASMIRDTRSFLGRTIDPDGTTLGFNVTTNKLERINPGTSWPGFGPRTALDSIGSALVESQVYQVPCDGFISAYMSTNGWVQLFSDSSNPPITLIQHDSEGDMSTNRADVFGAIPKGDYFMLIGQDSPLPGISWVPIGTGNPVQV